MKYYSFGDIIRKVQPTTTVNVALPNTIYYNNLGAVVNSYSSGGPVQVLQKTGSIVYSRSSKRFPKRSNICIHSRSERMMGNGECPVLHAQDLRPAFPGWHWDIYWDYLKSYEAHTAAVTAALAQFGVIGLAKLQAGWQDYAGIGFQACQPDLTFVSVPNFIIDADQMLDLWSDVRLLKKAGVVLTSGFDKAPSLREAAKFVAGKRLSYKFGWKPTIGDLSSMISAFTGLQAKLKAFKDNIGKEMKFTKTIENVNIAKSGSFNLSGDVHYKVNWTGGLIGQVKYHARYIPRPLAVVGELDEALRLAADGFGFELNPQIIWDAIPFSFVLDWFLGVGDWLYQFRKDALELPIDLVDSSVSYKEDYTVASNVIVNPNGYPTDVTSTTRPAGCYSRNRLFHRMPVDPTIAQFKGLHWKNPTGSQWTNFVSLATVLGL